MVKPFYDGLSMEEVATTYNLIKFLRRLRVIGNLECRTVGNLDVLDVMGRFDVAEIVDNGYSIYKVSYSNDKSQQDAEELLENIFGRAGPRYTGLP